MSDTLHGCEAGYSGSGVDIFGSRESVKRVAEWHHAAETVPALRERLVEEHAIVDRVWKALGITDYVGAKGKAIDELVAEAVEKAWRYDQLNK